MRNTFHDFYLVHFVRRLQDFLRWGSELTTSGREQYLRKQMTSKLVFNCQPKDLIVVCSSNSSRSLWQEFDRLRGPFSSLYFKKPHTYTRFRLDLIQTTPLSVPGSIRLNACILTHLVTDFRMLSHGDGQSVRRSWLRGTSSARAYSYFARL